ncbi:MAG: tetratricopeptide repeat protein [Alphaproteobacteria bacterium]
MHEDGSLERREAAAMMRQARIRKALGDWSGSLAAADAVLEIDPENVEAELMRATALLSLRRLEDATKSVKRVIRHLPDDGGLQLFHARCLMAQEKFAEAVSPARRAAERLPDTADAQYACGACLKRTGDHGAAIPYLERALALDASRYDALNDLGDIHIARGELQSALCFFRQSHAILPYNVNAMSALCFYSAFDPHTDAAALFAIRRDLGRHLEHEAGNRPAPVPAAPRPDGRIRIGYLSYDLCYGVTSWFLEPVLARHDRRRFHITGYHGNPVKDETTARLGSHADAWRDIAGDSVKQTAERIRRDGIDILVLVSFYNGKDHRVLAHRPAPIQVGYFNRVASTGLDSVDYILTEPLADPAGGVEHLYTESLVRLTDHPGYLPPGDAPALSPPPFQKNGYITFGSFNNHTKIGPAVIRAWSAILQAVPDARLILRSASYFGDADTVDLFRRQFVAHDINPARLAFQGMRATRNDHLSGIGEADIALDPFPCNGGTTTCDTMLMGVPLVTLVSDSFMGRQGLRYITRLGMGDLAARSVDGYVATAASLAVDRDRLVSLRNALRERFARNMMNYGLHIRELETAYAHMWQKHLSGADRTDFSVRDTRVIVTRNGNHPTIGDKFQ